MPAVFHFWKTSCMASVYPFLDRPPVDWCVNQVYGARALRCSPRPARQVSKQNIKNQNTQSSPEEKRQPLGFTRAGREHASLCVARCLTTAAVGSRDLTCTTKSID